MRPRSISWPTHFILAAVLICLSQIAPLAQKKALTADDYKRAEKYMTYNMAPLVLRSGVRPTWLPDGRFWYRITTEKGTEFILVDPAKGTREPAFDHTKMASSLSLASGNRVQAFALPFQQLEFAASGSIIVSFQGKRFECSPSGDTCNPSGQSASTRAGQGGGRRGDAGFGANMALSPDGKKLAFIKDNNLWIREVGTTNEKQLTFDGAKDYGYATNNAGWSRSETPVVAWSPDSKKIATFRHDGREVGEMYLVDTKVGHPSLQAWKYPLPGDKSVFMIERVIIDVDAAKLVRLKMAPDAHRSTLCDHVVCGGVWADVEWSADSRQLAFVSTSRDHKEETLRVANPETGDVRDVLNEKVATFFESGNGKVNWHFLPASNEVLWFSERDNWGQVYLYDLTTGKLKNQITTGEGNVTQVIRIDEKNRKLYFLGVGKEKGRDPYFRHFYSVGFDGKAQKLLTTDDGDHDIALAPKGDYFTDSYSKPDVPPTAVLRDLTGKLVVELEKADISKLKAAGWKAPQPFTVKARDGVTDLYGLMYSPVNLEPGRKYPIINHIYPGPQTGSVGSRSFSPARGDAQAIAELGFVVVEIDGMGTPWRSKKFHEAYFGDMGDNTLPDQIAGMKELAKRFPYIDIERAGIYGHSGGGYATASALLRHPEFFKVGVSQAGNHDNREYEDDWAEKWSGLLVRNADGSSNYDSQANQNFARNLKGKLLLAHGTTDNNVPPYNTLLVVNELIKANKDFDLIMFPNRAHGFGNEPYMVRRRWDYFVRNLLGVEPPQEYEMRPTPPPGQGQGPQ